MHLYEKNCLKLNFYVVIVQTMNYYKDKYKPVKYGGRIKIMYYQTLEDLVAPVAEHLVPEIKQSVDICVKSFLDDEVFNDKWIFGTHLWKNIWNRFAMIANYEDCPFEVYGKGNDYKLKVGPFVIRHHRVDRETKIPKGAKAVKSSAAAIQLALFTGNFDTTVEKDNIVIAIDADVKDGLREVFIGELMPQSIESKKYQWINKVPVFLADGFEHNSSDFIHAEDMLVPANLVPEEQISEVSIVLVRPKQKEEL